MGKAEENFDAATSSTSISENPTAITQHDRASKVFPLILPKYIDVNYSRLFQIDDSKDSQQDYCLFVHTNRLCVLTLAPSHPLCRLRHVPVAISFQISDGTDRALSHAQGHRKKGAQFLVPGSCLCHIDCSDSVRYDVISGIRGKLLEINSRLMDKPGLLLEKPFSTGYLAVIMPNEMEMNVIRNTLLDEEAYRKLRFPESQ